MVLQSITCTVAVSSILGQFFRWIHSKVTTSNPGSCRRHVQSLWQIETCVQLSETVSQSKNPSVQICSLLDTDLWLWDLSTDSTRDETETIEYWMSPTVIKILSAQIYPTEGSDYFLQFQLGLARNIRFKWLGHILRAGPGQITNHF